MRSTPGWLARQSGIWARRKSSICLASSWKVVLVVRPQPGQAVTLGLKSRRPSACRISSATTTSCVRDSPGWGVSETRMVSPMPSCSSTANAADDATVPLVPMPASVRPTWSAWSQRAASARCTEIRSRTPLTLQLMMTSFGSSPISPAAEADSIAEVTSASYITCCASQGTARQAFSSIRRARSSWSRLPQFTPMRTGLRCRQATSIICANCVSRLAPLPTLPGLMRYFESASAQAGTSVRSRWPL